MPLSPVLPLLSALACPYLMCNLSIETWLRFLAWLAIGMVVDVTYGRRNARLANGTTPYPEQDRSSAASGARRPSPARRTARAAVAVPRRPG